MRKGDAADPKGLIAEAFKINGITYEECRSIFLDWALAVPVDTESAALIKTLMSRYPQPQHRMTRVLEEGLTSCTPPRRRGGWRGRRS